MNPNLDPKGVDGKYVPKRAALGDLSAKRTMRWHFENLSAGIASLINMLDPELAVIGGGRSASGDRYVAELKLHIQAIVIPELAAGVDLSVAELAGAAGSIGAAFMAIKRTLTAV